MARSGLGWLAAGSLGILFAVGCTSPLSLEDRPCPCSGEFVCCASLGMCLLETQHCPSASPVDALAQEASFDPPDGRVSGADDGSPPADAAVAERDAGARDPGDASVESGEASDARDASIDPTSERVPIEGGLDRDAPVDVSSERASSIDGGVEGSNGDVDAAPVPRWQTLGDLSAYESGQYELAVVGGVPFIGMHRFMFPGRARVCVALRYDGSAWQKLGADLAGTEMFAFAVSPDGTPHMVSNGFVNAFQQGQWRALPDIGNGYFIPIGNPAIAFDRTGRLYAVVHQPPTGIDGSTGTDSSVIARFNGTSWDLLGGPLASVQYPIAFGFDGTAPYVAISNLDTFEHEVRRFNGTTWNMVGGGTVLDANQQVFAVSSAGIAYLASSSGGSFSFWQAGATPWVASPMVGSYAGASATPSIDVASDDALHVAYLTDRDPGANIVPGPLVARLTGTQLQDLSVAGLDPSIFGIVKLKVARVGSRDVPYIAYETINTLIVKKLE